MKKFLSVLLTVALVVVMFVGCGSKETPKSTTTIEQKDTYTIGLIQFMEHPSLDEIRLSFEEELQSLADGKNIKIQIDYKNAQGDMSIIPDICRNFKEDKVDVIVGIATPSVQGAASVTKDIPIIFSAVTDPVSAGLMDDVIKPNGNITGVSDAIDVEKIFGLAKELTPDAKHFGLLYNKGESNSVSVIEDVKAYLDANGYTYTEKVVTDTGEVQQATRALLETTDALFIPIDNTVASTMAMLSKEANKMKVPVYVAADSMVNDGGLATVGVNYTELGKKTAEMTMSVLGGTSISELPVITMDDGRPVVNEATAKEIGVDVSAYIGK